MDFGGSTTAYRENPEFEFEDLGSFVFATYEELAVEEIPPDRLGTRFLGDPGAAILFGL